jgi:hypothetical protein
MFTHLMFGALAVALRRSEFDPACAGQTAAADQAANPRWKPVVEVASGGVIVVVAVGARLAVAYGWLN